MNPGTSKMPRNGLKRKATDGEEDANFIDLQDLPFAFRSHGPPADDADELQLIDETSETLPDLLNGQSNGKAAVVEEDDEIQFVMEVPASSKQNGGVATRKRKVALASPEPKAAVQEDEVQVVATKRVRIATAQPNGQLTIIERIEAYRAKFPKKFQHFDRQILRFYEKNLQNELTFAWKMRCRNDLQTRIAQIFSHARLYAVGSTINGCGSHDSDMDLCCHIADAPPGGGSRGYVMNCLHKIQRQLWKTFGRGVMRNCTLISAKVPILRIEFETLYAGLQVDLNVNNEAGIRNSILLHYYARIDDRLPAMCLLIKKWAKQQSIADAMMGTLNSYSLILLCIHYLQHVKVLPNLQALYPDHFDERRPLDNLALFQQLEARYPPSPNTQSVGELLIGFFDYMCNFPFHSHAISIRQNRVIHRQTLPANTNRFFIFIEEPFDLNNTARCVTKKYNYDLILEAFRLARAHFLGKRLPDLRKLIVMETDGQE
ncbi:hypothetical protein M3Y99_00956500 [Aphelenchoides fujianensis]|nr:hypothetical protein M3Y99_00956500 [Aphelenchoides fujianensis]